MGIEVVCDQCEKRAFVRINERTKLEFPEGWKLHMKDEQDYWVCAPSCLQGLKSKLASEELVILNPVLGGEGG